jgi:hypothetical protein
MITPTEATLNSGARVQMQTTAGGRCIVVELGGADESGELIWVRALRGRRDRVLAAPEHLHFDRPHTDSPPDRRHGR